MIQLDVCVLKYSNSLESRATFSAIRAKQSTANKTISPETVRSEENGDHSEDITQTGNH